MVPATTWHIRGRFHPQRIVEPALDQVELQLAVGDHQLIALALRLIDHSRKDCSAAAIIDMHPRRQRESVKEAKISGFPQGERCLAVKLHGPAYRSRGKSAIAGGQ